jgi:diaminohydroxyphosphoribosylaminopyrimidine deaminase / 5-amino-6-(5-phosphoribosylamino)uracil reductase
VLPDASGKVELAAMMQALGARGFNEVLVEAGFKLNGSLLRAGVVDELIIYLAPHLLGDAARGMFNLPALDDLAGRRELSIRELRQVGTDLRITARLT